MTLPYQSSKVKSPEGFNLSKVSSVLEQEASIIITQAESIYIKPKIKVHVKLCVSVQH